MANTYTQMNIHAVFSVKGRSNFISEKWRDELFRYMAGTLKETKNYSLAVGGYKDHIHIFF
jgi:REP element-mobilizing transposase RayT